VTFNPLDLENLGDSIARAIGATDPTPLGALPPFNGAGIYAVYYSGDHPAYSQLVAANRIAVEQHPIYVGQAASAGARKGVAPATGGSALRSRLVQHGNSVAAATNLRLEDFQARWLVLEHVWVNLGESVLIRRHSPVWNSLVEGFGNHDPGAGRLAGAKSPWDVLHPGRGWADRLTQSPQDPESIVRDVQEYLRQRF
jgi:hypothetical protein